MEGTTRDVTGRCGRTCQSVGEWVCKYGKTTHWTCGKIIGLSYDPQYDVQMAGTFILVDKDCYGCSNPLINFGDSGGPWVRASTGIAYGISSGMTATDDAKYMAINYATEKNFVALTK